MINIPVLITGTIFIMVFSWFFSIKYRRYHGIVRFFAFESIFILLLLNYKFWFVNPFSPMQLTSWIFLLLSVYPGIAGYFILRRKGKSVESFENTTVLVKTGIYMYIRHPLYFSLLLFGTGVMFKQISTLQATLGAINFTAIFFTALIEEKEMITKFGKEYKEYMKASKMFIPYLI